MQHEAPLIPVRSLRRTNVGEVTIDDVGDECPRRSAQRLQSLVRDDLSLPMMVNDKPVTLGHAACGQKVRHRGIASDGYGDRNVAGKGSRMPMDTVKSPCSRRRGALHRLSAPLAGPSETRMRQLICRECPK
jgi:hypothetical protein